MTEAQRTYHREYKRRQRQDPEFRERERETHREYNRQRWANDPEYRLATYERLKARRAAFREAGILA